MFLIDDDSLFKPSHKPNEIAKINDYLFIYKDNNIGVTSNDEIPSYLQTLSTHRYYCFGHIANKKCLLFPLNEINDIKFTEVRLSFKTLSRECYQAAAFGNHINHFRNHHRYCSNCTSSMIDKLDELALICSSCREIVYPKISPCVIVLITRGEDILLARSPHFLPQVMSTLAGFVTVGESIEQAVIREVKEEVNIEVNNLKYICSQPWPFPDSLMLGFMAQYVSGEILIDHREIEAAGWFNKKNLPLLPNNMSIARYLIDSYLLNG